MPIVFPILRFCKHIELCVKVSTLKVTSQLTNGNKIKRKIRNMEYRGKGQGRKGTSQANAFSYGLRTISEGNSG